MRMLIAVEPRAYREAIGFAVENLRPGVKVAVRHPDDLAAEVACLGAKLVVCSERDQQASQTVVAWMELRAPQGHPQMAKVRIGDHRFEIANVQLDDLLSVVDRVGEAVRTDRLSGTR